MASLSDHDQNTLGALIAGWGFKASHARKVLRSFYKSGETNFEEQGIGNELRRRLGEEFGQRGTQVIERRRSADGTIKLLMGMERGGAVEAVLMPAYRDGVAAGCISSQIGCAMGCDFCASTKAGLERNLEAGEMVDQFLALKAEARGLGRRLKTVVFMGMGEPMHNLDNVLAAVRRMADPELGELGWRNLTISTVGIVPGIDRLAEEDLNVQLAVSLHAADDPTRSRIVPSNRRYPVAEVMAATKRFAMRSGRIPTIEYCLLAGVNDSEEHARRLAELMRGFRAHVNLIPYNWIGAGVSGAVYQRPGRESIKVFYSVLRRAQVVVHMRDTRGDDVAAACGQLRQISMSE